MKSEKLQIKFFAKPNPAFDVEAIVPVFHRFIREHAFDELMIDVADYKHVKNGPGIALIGDANDYFLDEGEGRAGLLFSRKRHGAGDKQIEIVRAPGAFDMPVVARKLAQSRKYDAIVALGAVIKGATAHFDYVAGQCASGLARVSQDTGVPIAFGVLTTDTIEQAIERAGTKAGNKGADAAVTAIELANLLRRIES